MAARATDLSLWQCLPKCRSDASLTWRQPERNKCWSCAQPSAMAHTPVLVTACLAKKKKPHWKSRTKHHGGIDYYLSKLVIDVCYKTTGAERERESGGGGGYGEEGKTDCFGNTSRQKIQKQTMSSWLWSWRCSSNTTLPWKQRLFRNTTFLPRAQPWVCTVRK